MLSAVRTLTLTHKGNLTPAGFSKCGSKHPIKSTERNFSLPPPPLYYQQVSKLVVCCQSFYPTCCVDFISFTSCPPSVKLIFNLFCKCCRAGFHPPVAETSCSGLCLESGEVNLYLHQEKGHSVRLQGPGELHVLHFCLDLCHLSTVFVVLHRKQSYLHHFSLHLVVM